IPQSAAARDLGVKGVVPRRGIGGIEREADNGVADRRCPISGNAHLLQQLLVRVERIEIVIEVKTYRRGAGTGLGPLVEEPDRRALALHDVVGIGSVELDEAWPGTVVDGQRGSVGRCARPQVRNLVVTIADGGVSLAKGLVGAQAVAAPDKAVIETGDD